MVIRPFSCNPNDNKYGNFQIFDSIKTKVIGVICNNY